MLAGMLKGVKAEFYAASSREPEVYRGRPFQIEAAIAFGGELPADDTGRVPPLRAQDDRVRAALRRPRRPAAEARIDDGHGP